MALIGIDGPRTDTKTLAYELRAFCEDGTTDVQTYEDYDWMMISMAFCEDETMDNRPYSMSMMIEW